MILVTNIRSDIWLIKVIWRKVYDMNFPRCASWYAFWSWKDRSISIYLKRKSCLQANAEACFDCKTGSATLICQLSAIVLIWSSITHHMTVEQNLFFLCFCILHSAFESPRTNLLIVDNVERSLCSSQALHHGLTLEHIFVFFMFSYFSLESPRTNLPIVTRAIGCDAHPRPSITGWQLSTQRGAAPS